MTGTVQPAVSPPLFGGPVTPFLAAILGPPSELHIAALQHISVDAVSAAECAGSPLSEMPPRRVTSGAPQEPSSEMPSGGVDVLSSAWPRLP